MAKLLSLLTTLALASVALAAPCNDHNDSGNGNSGHNKGTSPSASHSASPSYSPSPSSSASSSPSSSASSSPSTGGGASNAAKYGIKADSMLSHGGVYFGYAPNYSPQITMQDLNSATGQKGALYNVYSQLNSDNVNSGSYDGNSQFNVDDIISSGAVLIVSLMPTVDWTDVSSGLTDSVASYFQNTFTSKGVTIWLRFAHEMNYYSTSGTYPGGLNYDGFMTAWKNMYNSVHSNDKIFMYWSPNDDIPSEPAAPWWPGKQYVDMVGMDYYPNSDSGLPTFDTAYGAFYKTYAEANGLPFVIGETGTQSSSGSASTSQKEEWLKNIINPSSGLSDYPLYMGCTWFEYGPPTNGNNYYIVYGLDQQSLQETISNTKNGVA